MLEQIYVNGRFLSHKMDGIGRFSVEICKQLQKLGLNFKIVIPNWLDYENREGFELVKFGNLKSHFWEQVDLPRFLKRRGKPLLVNFSGLGPLFYRNQIITIHDLSFYANKTWFSKAYTLAYGFATPIVAKNSKKIFTVSNFSKSEIIKFLKVEEAKIQVIYNAVDNELGNRLRPTEISEPLLPIIKNKYILAVSSIDPRKNLQRLIDSFLKLGLADYKLVLVGKTSSHFNIDLSSDNQNVVFTGFVTDADLSALYKNCEFFIYPSLYEGFGIPPLEAMKSGCAVIASDIPSLQEVCAEAVLYVDPYDTEDMKNKMLEIITNTDLKKELKARGTTRSRFFTWEDSGKKVINHIKQLG